MTKILNILILAIVLTLTTQAAKVNLFTSGNGGDAPYDLELFIQGDILGSEIISTDFGDGSGVQAGFVPTHTYDLPGEYLVTIVYDEVIGDDNEEKEETKTEGLEKTFLITVTELLEVEISTTSVTECNAPMCINMSSAITIAIDASNYTYSWDVDGTEVSTEAEPQICFVTPGAKTVTLTVTGYLDETVKQETIDVTVWPEFAVDFTSDQSSATFVMDYDEVTNEWTGGDITFTDATAGNNIQDNNSWKVDATEAQAGGDTYVLTIDNISNDGIEDQYLVDYVISLEANNDCLDSDGEQVAGTQTMTVTVYADSQSGVAEFVDGVNVETFGNVFQYSATGQNIESIEAINIMGVTVSTVDYSNRLDLTNVAKGLYFVKITTNAQVFTTKVMVD